MRRMVRLVFVLLVSYTGGAFGQQALYWKLTDDSVFAQRHTFRDSSGNTVGTLSGRALTAMMEAQRRIAAEYGIKPEFLLNNQRGINAFAAEIQGRAIVSVNADTVTAIGDRQDVWAALFGHEFGHLYHHHSASHQTRAALIDLAATLLDAYQTKHGRNRTDLIKFGAQLVDNVFTRDQEREADATGVTYMARAGFKPEGAIALQQLLLSQPGASGGLAFLQSHPSGEERINNIRQQIASSSLQYGSHTPEFSLPEFKRWVTVCGTEVKDKRLTGSPGFNAMYQCLKAQNAQVAQRFALCTFDMEVMKQSGSAALASCADAYSQQHGYDAWVRYCTVDAQQQSSDPTTIRDTAQRCVWDQAASLAFRGALCESDAQVARIPTENRWSFLRTCSTESSDPKTRFTLESWKTACNRKGALMGRSAALSQTIEQECLAEGPADLRPSDVALAGKAKWTAQQLLEEVKTALRKYDAIPKAAINPPITECDRLASVEALGEIRPHYVGFIDAPQAEQACLEAIKNAKDPSRFQSHLAAVYLQQGRLAEAADLATKAHKRNAMDAGNVLAVMYSHALGGMPRDPAKAISLLLASVKQGSVDALIDLAAKLRDGAGVEKQTAAALELLTMAADRGSAQAKASLGQVYFVGKDVPQNIPEATKWLRAAGDEFPPALLGLAIVLRGTPGSSQDEVRQIQTRLMDKAKLFADQGSLSAKLLLASIYSNGVGVSRDREKAVGLYQDVAQSGHPSATLSLAFAYLNGAGVPQDKDKAISYFKKASAAGVQEADVQLARLQAAP